MLVPYFSTCNITHTHICIYCGIYWKRNEMYENKTTIITHIARNVVANKSLEKNQYLRRKWVLSVKISALYIYTHVCISVSLYTNKHIRTSIKRIRHVSTHIYVRRPEVIYCEFDSKRRTKLFVDVWPGTVSERNVSI